jgi:serine/threonine-protein kinase RsbT
MSPTRRDGMTVCRVRSEVDLLDVRTVLRTQAQTIGLGTVAETKLVTAASELARNIIKHSLGGSVAVSQVSEQGRSGIRATFADEGPGIAAVDRAMLDGWSSVGSLGLGLPGARRLVDEFDIESSAAGTVVTVTMWAR